MKGHRPPITSWRAFVDCEQIGFRYKTKADAIKASQTYIAAHFEPHMLTPVVVIRPSYTPINLDTTDRALSVSTN